MLNKLFPKNLKEILYYAIIFLVIYLPILYLRLRYDLINEHQVEKIYEKSNTLYQIYKNFQNKKMLFYLGDIMIWLYYFYLDAFFIINLIFSLFFGGKILLLRHFLHIISVLIMLNALDLLVQIHLLFWQIVSIAFISTMILYVTQIIIFFILKRIFKCLL